MPNLRGEAQERQIRLVNFLEGIALTVAANPSNGGNPHTP
jgi:hypothetical protein